VNAGSQPIKNFVRFFTLFAFGLVAHAAAGGSFVSFTQLFALATLVGLVLFCAQKVELEGPQLATVIVIVQSISHFIFGAYSHSSTQVMTYAHLASGILSYAAITFSDEIWDFLSRAISIPLGILYFSQIPVVFRIKPKSIFDPVLPNKYFASVHFRGPPLTWEDL